MEEASMKRAAVRWAVGLLTDGIVLGSLHPEFAGESEEKRKSVGHSKKPREKYS
jgi:hypothetical protein